MIELFYVSIGCIISTLLFHFPKLIPKNENNANDFEIIFGKNYKTLFEGEQDQVHLAFVMLWESYREEFLEALKNHSSEFYIKRDFTKWLLENYPDDFKPKIRHYNGMEDRGYTCSKGLNFIINKLSYVSVLPEEKMKKRADFLEDFVRTRLIGDKILNANDLNRILTYMVRNRNYNKII